MQRHEQEKDAEKEIIALLLALCITQGLVSPALAAETAATIRLTKTTGTVSVSKSSGKSLTLLSNMRLYNGYHVTTSAKSYAWMNLDDTKLIKEDAASEVEVRKSGKVLEVNISSGNVFFDVSEELEDDESLNISTSTMIVGIRGTAGYVKVVDRWTTELTVLEGVIQCSVADPVTGQIKSETVRGGETVQCVVYPQDQPGDKCDILREKTAVEDIPGYVLTDVVRDMELCDRIEADTGTDILEELAKIVGGDPSGRSKDGLSASPEVLGEVDRLENQDETKLQEKQEQIDAGQKAQESAESSDKVFAQTPSQSDDSGGKTLNLETGVNMTVESGGGLSVAGTVNAGNFTNNGTTTVSSSNTLRLSGDLSGSGQLIVTATGRVVAEGSCTWGSAALASGAQVLSKNGFGSSPIPSGWEVSATADSGGYYSLVEEPVPTPGQTYTVTFDPNGGGWNGDTASKRLATGTDGRLAAADIPADPARSGFAFGGWNTQTDGSGTSISAVNTYAFTADTTLYAQWKELYRIIFDPNGGNWDGDTAPKSLTTGTDGKLAAGDIPADPIQDGYAFDGWYIAVEGEDGQPAQPKIDLSQYLFTKDTTVYAEWTENRHDLDLDSYSTQTEALTAIQNALNGSTYTRVNVTSSASTLSIQSGLAVPAGKVLNLDCPFTLGSAGGSTQGTLTVNGTLALNSLQTGTVYSGSKISVAGTGTIVDYGKVTVNSGGAVENAGTFNTGYSYEDCLTIEAGGTFTNTGKLHLGYFNAFTNNGTFTNAAGGVLDGGSGSGTNKGTFINSGTVDSSATITNASGGTLTNNGTIESSSFTNQTGGTLTNNGTLINEENGYFYNDGTLTNNGTITNNGTYYGEPITGGTVNGANAGQVTGGNQKPEEGTP